MNKLYILTTSGFILPDNKHYSVLTESKVMDTSIFNRSSLVNSDSVIAELTKSNSVHHSEEANNVYKKYEINKSFEDYVGMLDIACEVLSKINYQTFFELQANNPHMSPVSFKFCMDIYTGSLINNYAQYNAMPFSARFSLNNSADKKILLDNTRRLHTHKAERYNDWSSVLADLYLDRNAFATFFKYIFCDSY